MKLFSSLRTTCRQADPVKMRKFLGRAVEKVVIHQTSHEKAADIASICSVATSTCKAATRSLRLTGFGIA